MSVVDAVRRRFARPPDPVRAAVSADPDERVLAWGALVGDEGWLVATSRGLRLVGPALAAGVQPWHEVGHARWSAAGAGGTFAVTPLVDVEPGVQARGEVRRYVLAEAGNLPDVVRKRVDATVLDSRRTALPGGGGALLVARRIPGQAAREWTVVFDDDADRGDPAAREAARAELAALVDGDQP
ncbi:hypothetical protein [Blastococcus sp. TF02A-30]|uniref:hypothetical protein n=1 Tax=Blastococcus sp. TF02A-30 TaxID=2250580 RepID=UPI000DE84CBC|nr:hypothetical protein [Blastococcus sp. TF02A-30]RBY84841.1 hypothetical protein DQ241_16085 [Blastococcus sp. TF02A-30]